MGFNVLKEASENYIARKELKKRGLDFTSPIFIRTLRKLRLIGGINIGDVRKSWDVLKTVDFIRKNVKPGAKILDLGSYASEILPILHRSGYTALKGVDLNPGLRKMPYSDTVNYSVCNFMDGSLSGKFDVVTAISVIEHGFNEGELVKVLTDLVAPGGYFIASVDYWPEKINTSGIKAFGLDWRIFSEQDVKDFFARAAAAGFTPCSELDFKGKDAVIKWMGEDYTFAWFVLKRSL